MIRTRPGTSRSRTLSRTLMAAALAAVWVVLQGGSCGRKPALPEPSTKTYGDAIRSFFVGVAALQAGDTNRALKELTAATQIAPGEPAAWANLAILDLRGQRTDDAAKHIAAARDLAPDDSRIIYLAGLAKSQKGDFAGAAADYRKAAELDPNNLRARYSLVEQVQQSGGPNADADARKLLLEIAQSHPDNLVVQLDLARLASKQGDAQALKDAAARLSAASANWPANTKEQLTALQSAASSNNTRAATTPVLYLNNLLKQEAKYRSDYAALKAAPADLGEPILHPIKLPNPPPAIAAPDEGLTFAPNPQAAGAADFATAVYLGADSNPVAVTVAGGRMMVGGGKGPLPFPGSETGPGNGHPIVAVDLNSDFKTDLACAGSSGLKLYQQQADGSFADMTTKAKLPPVIATGSLRGAWAADIDMDGDLDLVVAPAAGAPVVLRNNADGTFKPLQPFTGVSGVVGFGWADLDNDGDPDAVLLDSTGKLHAFANERSGQFKESTLPSGFGPVAAFAILDSDDDGQLDVVALKQDGGLVRVERNLASDGWKTADVGRWDGAANLKPGSARLLAADLDNNGGVDLVASSGTESRVWLHGPNAAYRPLATPIPARVLAAADMNGDGRVDMVGVSADGKAVMLANQGKKSYAWQDIRPRATHATGDQRINSFGVGGDIEVRAGFLTQRQPIAAPVVHFGLGDNAGVDAARIFWPNGQMQAEFAMKAGQAVTAEQRLKGSCPWVFAWDGKKMAFVTDFLWRSPLGLKINAQDTGRVAMTEDWVRIPGERLVPRDGAYDIRITAELWETHFFDHVSLMTVDHPAGTEMWVDERFAIPPPKLGVTLTGPSRPVARATDDRGADVTATVRDLDGKYLDTFGRGYYQGVTRDHWVEADLGAGAPDAGPLWLVAQGWIHPTDSSINVAMAQGDRPKPRDLSLEIPDGKGGWTVAKPHLGFPAGKNKTVLIDLAGLWRPGQPKRLRLRTNLEVYWDRLAWAAGADSSAAKTQRALPASADLRYRGFSAVHQADASSPELPDYQDLAGTGPRWCDLVGYYTRFGDVRKLLRKVDDRYVIMNAGDEMVFRFPVPDPPPAGWVRDFVLVGNGWEKDGDLNTGFSKTVLPLPSHSDPVYNTPPTTLENDPVYRRWPRDWQEYHTRYVTPEAYWNALRPRVSQ